MSRFAPASLRAAFTGLACGFTLAISAMAEATRVEPPLRVSEWASAYRMVSAESGSPFPGAWDNERLPYLVTIMDRMGPEDPCRSVRLRGSSQTGKSEAALNALFAWLDQTPGPALALLPSTDEAGKYNKVKFDCTVRESPRLRRKIAAQTGRSGEESTSGFKRVTGGFVVIAHAGSSKPLQMISVGRAIFEEIVEYEDDVDGRGHPIDQGRKRGTMYGDDFKDFVVSTTGRKGHCRMSEEFEAGDQAWFYEPCPHCDGFYALKFEGMTGPMPDAPRETVGFHCPGCGCKAESWHRHAMTAGGVWVPCFESSDPANPVPPDYIPAEQIADHAFLLGSDGVWHTKRNLEGRPASFHIWQAMNPQIAWEAIWREWRAVCEGRLDAKVFWQQTLGLPFDTASERPEYAALHEARGQIFKQGGVVPPFAAFLTGATDVQGDRLEWAVWAWGRGGIGFRVARGVISGDPRNPQTWRELDRVREQTWSGPAFAPARPVRWGVDSGYETMEVYRYCARHRGVGVYALKGMTGARAHEAVPIAPGGRRKIKLGGKTVGRITPHLVGGHGLKGRVYYGLAAGMESGKGPIQPRALLFPADATEEDFRQMTAEVLRLDDPKRPEGKWVQVQQQPNEQLDMAVYCLALAIGYGLDRFDEAQWQALYEEARPDTDPALVDAAPLEALWETGGGAPQADPDMLAVDETDALADLAALGRDNLNDEDEAYGV